MNLNRKRELLINGKIQQVNGSTVWSNGWFAHDGCHKFYILESRKDLLEAMGTGYRIYPIEELIKTYSASSCVLKFIRNWKGSVHYVYQFEEFSPSETDASREKIDEIMNADR